MSLHWYHAPEPRTKTAGLVGAYLFNVLLDNTHNVAFAQDQILLAVLLEFGSGILREQHSLPDAYFQRGTLAIVQHLAGTNRQNFALLGLLFRCIRQHDSASSDGLAR